METQSRCVGGRHETIYCFPKRTNRRGPGLSLVVLRGRCHRQDVALLRRRLGQLPRLRRVRRPWRAAGAEEPRFTRLA